MDYSENRYQALVEDIFKRFPSVQKDGFTPGAYKPGLDRMRAFDKALGYPSRQFKAIHIAGTNGKGSVANMLASALTACGFTTGLFTSPHILDFRERMRIGAPVPLRVALQPCTGKCYAAPEPLSSMIPKQYVFDFLTEWLPWITENELSFFEITTGLAFKWFAHSHVDYAVIETGLGGRLDSTNIIEKPSITIITSIGLDHMAMLGDSVEKIAEEKAGIFKAGVPALIGEATPQTRPVFEAKACGLCPLSFAQETTPAFWDSREQILLAMDLQASVQRSNLRTVLSALDILGLSSPAAVDGIIHTARNMDFHGRWERLRGKPLVIADIGHNAHALQHIFRQLEALGRPLIIVYGIMADKDLDAIIPLMPRNSRYIFTAPDTPRALPARDILTRFMRSFWGPCPPQDDNSHTWPSPIQRIPSQVTKQSVAGDASLCCRSAKNAGPATQIGHQSQITSQVTQKTQTCDAADGDLRRNNEGPATHQPETCDAMAMGDASAIDNVKEAVMKALEMAGEDTIIYIGGSTFVVSEALPLFR